MRGNKSVFVWDGAGGGREKEVCCGTGDPQSLAAPEDHIGRSFPLKPPLVDVSVGCSPCPSG